MSIERFTVLGLLGMGGQANIYLGTCNDSLLAFKCFNKPFKEDFEAALLLGLLEDRVIKPLGISIESSFPGIVTEYVPGSNLRLILNFLAEHELKFPFHAVLYLAQEIIFVLTSIHAQGIIHNDLSPANILLKPDGSLKLCDLGSASITGRTRSFGPAFGKKDYMALELLFDGEPSVSSDYYALGTIIFELLTGQCFIASNPARSVPLLEELQVFSPRLFDWLFRTLAPIQYMRPSPWSFPAIDQTLIIKGSKELLKLISLAPVLIESAGPLEHRVFEFVAFTNAEL